VNFGSTGSLCPSWGGRHRGPDVLPLHPRTPQAVLGVAGHGRDRRAEHPPAAAGHSGGRPRVWPGDGKVTEVEHWTVAVTSHQLVSADGNRTAWPRGRRVPVMQAAQYSGCVT
jgi:hypothetical protein